MVSNVACGLFLLATVATSVQGTVVAAKSSGTVEAAANPIRRVVTMLQMMVKKVEAEGEKEAELYEKYQCYCKSGKGTLSQSIADNDAKIPQVQSDIEEAESKLATTKQELAQHQTDRDAAKEAMAKATEIREKEHAAFVKEKEEQDANLAALNKAIPAIEKGMSGGFLQTSTAALLRRFATGDNGLSEFDRASLATFLQGGSGAGYAPASGEIVGILKQLRDTMDKDVADLIAAEEAAKTSYDELMAAKQKEVDQHQSAIERKTVQIGELGVEIVNMKEDLSDSEEALIEDTKFLQDLGKNCAAKAKEIAERVKTRGDELVALAETIKVLNDDDALELFKKTLPSSSFLQVGTSMDSVRRRALAEVRSMRHSRSTHRPQIDLIALALTGKKVDFSKVIKMVDDMVVLLGKEQKDDNYKKEYCEGQLDFTDDKIKELTHTIGDLDTQIADLGETIKITAEEIKGLADGIVALDKSVAAATEQRKAEHADYSGLMAGNTGAKELIEFAKNRMNKFYNPKLYKAPPKRELSEEERITLNMGGTLAPTAAPGGIAGTGVGFMQIVATRATIQKDAPGPPPDTGSYAKKGEESGGVIGMMDLMIKDLDKEIQEATMEENDGQKEYTQMLGDAATKRGDDTQAIANKESAKADAEADLTAANDNKAGKTDELMATKGYESQLHGECDWLIQNFDLRKTARAEEVDSLKKAKAVLSGADFSFVQVTAAGLHRH